MKSNCHIWPNKGIFQCITKKKRKKKKKKKRRRRRRLRESEQFIDGDSGHVFLIFILYHVHPLKKKSLTDSQNSEFPAIHIFFF